MGRDKGKREKQTVRDFLMFIFERDKQCEQGSGRERETQNPKQAPGSELSAQSLTWGSDS